MNRNSIRWRLPASYAVIALLAALSLGSMMLLVLRDYYANQERDYLSGNAFALQPLIEQILQSDLPEVPLQDQITGLAFLSQAQIRLLDANGNTLADSGVPDSNQVLAVSAGMPVAGNVMFSMPVNPPVDKGPILIYRSDESAPFPQVVPFEKQILPGKSSADIVVPVSASPYGYGFVARVDSDPSRRSLQSVSVLLTASDGRKLGVLEFSNGPSYGADVIASVTEAWIIASIFAIAIAAFTGWFMSQRVTRPVLALENATRKMEQGNLVVRVNLPDEKQQEFLSLANSFNGMAEQVEQTVSTLRAFIADAAHELHTPLTALQTNLELANEEDASARTLYLSRAQEQARRLEALVKSLLDLSRIESVQVNHDFAPFDLNQIVSEISEQFASRAEQSDRSFALDLPSEKIMVEGNEMQIKQVFGNLLENALKFTPENGIITLKLHNLNDEAIVTISDTGIGISPEDLPHMFERFHRGRNASEYAGNGLGLAIVKAIVESHSGHVEAQSKGIGEGSTFSIKLPIRY
ncbi:MAG TPA: HAMP domain-containing sensor histidine kinase [Anaerolineales bacterium]|nr:HAMP domain-containing sensor histidine kinase [Anaerolineales bacterium]